MTLYDPILAIKIPMCNRKKYCLHIKKKSGSCEDSLKRCPFLMFANPFCFNKDQNQCGRPWNIYELDGEKYAIYSCNNDCPFLVREKEKIMDIIKQTNKDVYVGKDLDKLISRIENKYEINNDKSSKKIKAFIRDYLESTGDVI